jgi:hypothetical protein
MSTAEPWPVLGQWCLDHRALAAFLRFDHLVSSNLIEKIPFSLRRSDVHGSALDHLSKAGVDADRRITIYQTRLAALTDAPAAVVAPHSFDKLSSIFLVRQHVFLLRKIQKHSISLLTQGYCLMSDRRDRITEMIHLFSGTIIPAQVIVQLDAAFFAFRAPDSFEQLDLRLKHLQARADVLKEQIDALPHSLWETDFAAFILDLIAKTHFDADASYVHPTDLELSLSRYLFNPYSPVRKRVDGQILQFLSMNPADFIDSLVNLCYEVVDGIAGLGSQEQSVALLLLFRAFFNRTYELFPSSFVTTTENALLAKIRDLSEIEVFRHNLPWKLLPRENRGMKIGDLFRNDRYFAAAGQYLSYPIFDANPIDALYRVHKSLVVIHKAAMIHRKNGESASPEDVTELLCFDDLFSLFYGTLMGSDAQDVFYVAKMITDYAPKACLSPAFEYAQANMEALVLHCKALNLEEMRVQEPGDGADDEGS